MDSFFYFSLIREIYKLYYEENNGLKPEGGLA